MTQLEQKSSVDHGKSMHETQVMDPIDFKTEEELRNLLLEDLGRKYDNSDDDVNIKFYAEAVLKIQEAQRDELLARAHLAQIIRSNSDNSDTFGVNEEKDEEYEEEMNPFSSSEEADKHVDRNAIPI